MRDTLKKLDLLPNDGSDDVYNAIMSYVNENVPWACMPFAGGTKGTCYVIFKPHPKEMVGMVLKEIARRVKTPPSEWSKALNPVDEMTMGAIKNVFEKMGTEFPMCSIGSTEHSATAFVIHYNGSIILDYADPEFFPQLDQVLSHIKISDGLSGFSLQPRSGVS